MCSGRSETPLRFLFFSGIVRFRRKFLAKFMRVCRVLVGLPGQLMRSKVIAFAMRRGSGRVSVGCEIVEFCNTVM